MSGFKENMKKYQIHWKTRNLPNIFNQGYQNRKGYDHILPKSNEQENFYPYIRKELFDPNIWIFKEE